MSQPPDEQIRVLRILDAAANRAGEGWRVVEDYVRFALDDRHLTAGAKQRRHDSAAIVAELPALERHAARPTQPDVGTPLATAPEHTRSEAIAVAAARLQ